MSETRIDLPQGTLDLLILRSLSLGPRHGWAISQRIQQVSKEVLRVQQGSLYPALYRMEKSGLVKARWDDKAKGRGPRRRVYRLTPKGRRQLQQGRQEWNHFVTVIGPIVGVTA